MEKNIVRCVVCGKVIENPRRNAKCCSKECRSAYHKETMRDYIKDYVRKRLDEDDEYRKKKNEYSRASYHRNQDSVRKSALSPYVDKIIEMVNEGKDKEEVLDYVNKYLRLKRC